MNKDVLKKKKLLREQRELTLRDVAKAIGYESSKGYYEVESGRIKLRLEHLEKLSTFYNVSMGYFFEK